MKTNTKTNNIIKISETDNEVIKELRTNFSKISFLGYPKITKRWRLNIKKIRHLVKYKDPRAFLRWDVIRATMYPSKSENYLMFERKQLMTKSKWLNNWQSINKGGNIGKPEINSYPPILSDANSIHHAYQLIQVEDKLKISFKKLNFIFEVGGGYGNMCRLIHNLGFKGTYVIFDLPELSYLQTFYLKLLKFNLNKIVLPTKNGIYCVSDFNNLKKLLQNIKLKREALFIATWSLSEVPIVLRNRIASLINGFNYYLITYQDSFDSIDNNEYFFKWRRMKKNVTWFNWEMKHISNNYYLIGKGDPQNKSLEKINSK